MRKFHAVIVCACLFDTVLASPQRQPGQGLITVPGGPVWYKVVGTGDGIPVIALHGGPGGTSCGYSLLNKLGDQRPIVRYDQLGTGRSGRPSDLSLWETDRFVEALDVILESLGTDKYHLLGHSWGASLAGAYVTTKGRDRFASVIFSSPLISTPKWIEDTNLLRSELPEDIRRALEEFLDWVVQADRDEGKRKDGATSAEREELRRLRTENRQLKLERKILSKAAAWFAQETVPNTKRSSNS